MSHYRCLLCPDDPLRTRRWLDITEHLNAAHANDPRADWQGWQIESDRPPSDLLREAGQLERRAAELRAWAQRAQT